MSNCEVRLNGTSSSFTMPYLLSTTLSSSPISLSISLSCLLQEKDGRKCDSGDEALQDQCCPLHLRYSEVFTCVFHAQGVFIGIEQYCRGHVPQHMCILHMFSSRQEALVMCVWDVGLVSVRFRKYYMFA